MLVHTHLPDSYLYHALLYACDIFNVLPVWELFNAEGKVTTPSFLFLGTKPLVCHFCIFRCPCITKKWTVHSDGHTVDNHNGTQHGIQSIFVSFPDSQKGHLLYVSSSCQLVVSRNVEFDETFFWQSLKHGAPFVTPSSSALKLPSSLIQLQYWRQLAPLMMFSCSLRRGKMKS